jgi:hypothetical protein
VPEGLRADGAVCAASAATGLVLPADSRIPVTLAVREAREAEGQRWQQPYVSRFLDLTGESDRVAWFHFCTGHHVEFLYWEATALACDRAASAAGAGDRARVEHWVARVAALVRGSAAMLHYCAAFDPGRYDPCLRPSMAAERDDFSGDMSRDFLAMMAARARLAEALQTTGGEHSETIRVLQAADAYWHRHHAEVIVSLHPGSSLLRDKFARLRREDAAFDPVHYIATVVHSEAALAACDDYFGVVRSQDMKIGDYWTQAIEKLATVHRSFAMDADTRTALMRGDGVLLSIVSETLAGETPKEAPPAASIDPGEPI